MADTIAIALVVVAGLLMIAYIVFRERVLAVFPSLREAFEGPKPGGTEVGGHLVRLIQTDQEKKIIRLYFIFAETDFRRTRFFRGLLGLTNSWEFFSPSRAWEKALILSTCFGGLTFSAFKLSSSNLSIWWMAGAGLLSIFSLFGIATFLDQVLWPREWMFAEIKKEHYFSAPGLRGHRLIESDTKRSGNWTYEKILLLRGSDWASIKDKTILEPPATSFVLKTLKVAGYFAFGAFLLLVVWPEIQKLPLNTILLLIACGLLIAIYSKIDALVRQRRSQRLDDDGSDD